MKMCIYVEKREKSKQTTASRRNLLNPKAFLRERKVDLLFVGPFPSNAEGLGRRLGLVTSCPLRVTRELCPGKTSSAGRMRSAAARAKGGDREGRNRPRRRGLLGGE